jgi:D-erythronate 2-dehydrogenase
MHILILGAAGMVGRKLIDRLVRDGGLNGKAIERLTLADVMSPEKPAGFAGAVDTVTMDLSASADADKIVSSRPDVIFHLAAIVSGEAEANFEKGYRINLDGTRALIEAIRRVGNGYKPKVIYTSSIAVFGAPFPEAIGD